MAIYDVPSYPLDAIMAGCANCGNPMTVEQDHCVSTDIKFPRIGRVCICQNCGREIGRAFGMVMPEETEPDEELASAQAEVDRLSQILAEAAATLEEAFTIVEDDLDD